ncbi:hypothetical protein THASP1DRAFT_29867 [Thamnocephalis sphaerospora]|uniref:Protein kinase domain-containing protein n=1 Tax=Thamnocephalis sphaerospora TaxID=78915 RepID=A0A4P9XGH0_9FUNG|nr:hypothetical protein THASP1DRAFT_33471 [Thamnocephalis sphaerospora]RKP08335.1 hypothetical protein THASP1DRAFT_29867 [Thamnocephalis sphaerospora]|eukprot:RKP04726.1 hypothetical protein THASP1DRAFT_33471 [Thamnocephalis sphaerospora]
MADEVYGTVFTRKTVKRDPIDADLDPNNIDRYLDPKKLPSGTKPYILSMLKKLKQARTCINANQYRYANFFNSKHYKRPSGANPSGEGSSSSRNEEGQAEPLPFQADEKELRFVQSHIDQLKGHEFFELVNSECDIRALIYSFLMETRPRLIKKLNLRMFAARDFKIYSGAAHRQKDDLQKKTYGLDVKPDFRLSIMLDALLGQEIRTTGIHPDHILEREVCFMQSEIKKGTEQSKSIRAKFYFQMVDAICRQEALLYGYTSENEIDNKPYPPFCVGSFAHGLEIDFYLGVSAHPGQNRRGYAIYLYKTVNLSPTRDGVIDETNYIEASVAFCNQVDLVLERLGHDHTGLKSGDRDAKRQVLNEISKKAESDARPNKRRRGNENQGGNDGAGGGNSDAVTYGSRDHVNCVWRTLEEANVIRRDSFKPLYPEARFSGRHSTDSCDSADNTDSESDMDEEQPFDSPSWMARAVSPDGQKIFIKVFSDTYFGQYEIWVNKLILRAAKLRSNMPITPQYGQLDGRVTKMGWTGECDGYPILVMNAEQEAKQPISTPMQLAKFAQDVATTLAILHDDVKVVHGDIKPKNLLVTKNDDGEQPNQSIKCEAIHALVTKMMDPVSEERPHARDVAEKAKSIQETLKTPSRNKTGSFRRAHTVTFESVDSTELHAGGSGIFHRSDSQDSLRPPSLVHGSSSSDNLPSNDPSPTKTEESPCPKAPSYLIVMEDSTELHAGGSGIFHRSGSQVLLRPPSLIHGSSSSDTSPSNDPSPTKAEESPCPKAPSYLEVVVEDTSQQQQAQQQQAQQQQAQQQQAQQPKTLQKTPPNKRTRQQRRRKAARRKP